MTGMLLQPGWWHVLASPLLLHVIRVSEGLLRIHADVGHPVAGMHRALRYRWPVRLGR